MSVSARQLEGTVVENGRFLLLRKLDHTPQRVRFVARDMVGGLEVELCLTPDRLRGYRVTTQALAATGRPELPDLCEREKTLEHALPTRRTKRGPVARLLRALEIVKTRDLKIG